MQSKTKNPKTREQIARMAARAFGGMALAAGVAATCELKDGWFNAAYEVRLADGREVILKIAPPQGAEVMQYEKSIMATEVATMRLVRQNPAIPVPEIYFYDDARDLCDSDYFFMEKVVGENLEHVKPSLPAETQAAVERRIGEIIREINTFRGTSFGYDGNPALRADTWREAFTRIVEAGLEDAAAKGVDLGYDYDAIRAAVERHAPALEQVTEPCLVHWDAWDPNFLVRDGQVVGIIDFERALWAEPLMEAQFRLLFRSGVSDALRGYGKTSFTRAEGRRCNLYTLHLALTMYVECFYRNYDTDVVFNLAKDLLEETMDWLKAN